MTTTTAKQRTGLYHSDLVKMGATVMMFTGKPRESTYKGKPPFCGIKFQGDDTAYTLTIENDDVRAAIEGAPLNKWLTVRAEGTRDQAYLNIEDEAGPIIPGTPDSEIIEPQGTPPPLWPEAGNGTPARTRTNVRPASTSNVAVDMAVAMTISAVRGLEEAGIRVDSDAAARIYNTHYIQASRG